VHGKMVYGARFVKLDIANLLNLQDLINFKLTEIY